jgi:hypothetical protein
MTENERVPLSRVESAFERFDYPVTRDDAAAELVDVTLTLANDEANLGALISELGSDAYHDPGELSVELRESLPGDGTDGPDRPDDGA